MSAQKACGHPRPSRAAAPPHLLMGGICMACARMRTPFLFSLLRRARLRTCTRQWTPMERATLGGGAGMVGRQGHVPCWGSEPTKQGAHAYRGFQEQTRLRWSATTYAHRGCCAPLPGPLQSAPTRPAVHSRSADHSLDEPAQLLALLHAGARLLPRHRQGLRPGVGAQHHTVCWSGMAEHGSSRRRTACPG